MMLWNRNIYRAVLIILLIVILITVMTAFAAVNVVPDNRLDDDFQLVTIPPFLPSNYVFDCGGKKLFIDITNISGSQSRLDAVDITWPSANGDLKEMLFESEQIFDITVPPTHLVVPDDQPWKAGTEDSRLIDDGQTKTLEIRFDQDVLSTGYYIVLTFSGGWSITIDA